MARNETEQFRELLRDKPRVLIAFGKHAGGDAIASACALAMFLEKTGITADMVSDGFTLPKGYEFLPKAADIKSRSEHIQKFILSVDIAGVGVQSLTHDIRDNMLRIAIAPKDGVLARDRIRTAQSEFLYDLAIVLDTPDIHALGGLYEKHTEFFYATPIVNIDHSPANEHFGHINIVDITASTTAEVVFGALKELGEEHIHDEMATVLLSGIIAHTRSFKNDATKPETLQNASALVALGADRERIVHHLFRTRTISALRLWGAVLSRLKQDRERHVVWSAITRDDVARTGATEADLPDVIDELIGNAPGADTIILLSESAAGIRVIAKTNRRQNARQLFQKFLPEGSNSIVSFTLPNTALADAEDAVIGHLRDSAS
jgi:nanoRNase/pAp phosphatase (c-di-AMP/oligoRNAs hydrolase)